jgi:prolipoprotein diacylglyceryltransferase
MVSYALGRVGCQVAGDGDWGVENFSPKPFSWLPDWMWAYNYPHNVNETGVRIEGCLDAKYCYQLEHPVFPTPFYEIVICLILFLFIWSLRKKFKIPGTLFAFYLILNGLERFFIEKIRVNIQMTIMGVKMTQAELISGLLIITGAFLWYYLYKKRPVS